MEGLIFGEDIVVQDDIWAASTCAAQRYRCTLGHKGRDGREVGSAEKERERMGGGGGGHDERWATKGEWAERSDARVRGETQERTLEEAAVGVMCPDDTRSDTCHTSHRSGWPLEDPTHDTLSSRPSTTTFLLLVASLSSLWRIGICELAAWSFRSNHPSTSDKRVTIDHHGSIHAAIRQTRIRHTSITLSMWRSSPIGTVGILPHRNRLWSRLPCPRSNGRPTSL